MLRISLIHVEHGDSIIIRFPNGKWGLIDCNMPYKPSGKHSVLEYLENSKVEALSFICLTHFHHDHFSGLNKILEKYRDKVKVFIDTGSDLSEVRWVPREEVMRMCHDSAKSLWPQHIQEYFK